MNNNRTLTMLFTTLLLLGATAASADTSPRNGVNKVYSTTPQGIREVPDHHRLDVEIWTDRGDGARYRAGESIEVFFRTNTDAWVAIYDIDTRGRVSKLFPSRHASNNFVRGGVVHRVPARYGTHFEVEGPSGWETLKAVASTSRRALRDYRLSDDRWDDRDGRYDDRDGRYDDRDGRYDDRYRPATSPVKAVPNRIREVPNDSPHYPAVVVDETRHYVRDSGRREPRPRRPWWDRR